MNPQPDSPAAWQALRASGAARLPPDFPDRVLRALRAQPAATRNIAGQIMVATCTAAACLIAVFFVHQHELAVTSRQALADWQQVSTQTELLTELP